MTLSTPAAQRRSAEMPALATAAAHRSAGPWTRAARRLARNRLVLMSAGILVLVCGIAYGAPLLVAIDPYQQNLRDSVFVEAARSLGASHGRIMFGHIVPHVLGPLITLATLGLATAILATESLSFLGLGAQPPTAEWGLMLSESRKYLRIGWWLAVFPGASIMLTVLAINVLGDGVRDALDPRLSVGVD